MSVEPLVLCSLVENGSPRPAYLAGLSNQDFDLYEKEFSWLEWRYENREAVNRRIFCERFPNFEFISPKDELGDLLSQLKQERAYSKIISAMETISDILLPENAISVAGQMKELLGDVVKGYSPHADVNLKDWESHYQQLKDFQKIIQSGKSLGMPTGLPSLDYHWDGFLPGRLISILGRPGHSKSFLAAYIAWQAIKNGYKLGFFSPEMNEFEHRCRIHTLASADPEIQKACGITQSFRNRDLMRGMVNTKQYKVFLEYFETLPGDCFLFTKKYRKAPMNIAFIEGKVEELELDGVIADPLNKLATTIHRDNPVHEDYDRVGSFIELGETYNIFTIATNWANRGINKDRPPTLDDSFGSDALAKESDHLMSVQYDEDERELMVRCTKSRFGKSEFTAILDFNPNVGIFREKDIPEDVIAGFKDLELQSKRWSKENE